MSTFVDPQHVEVIIAKARHEAEWGSCADCNVCHRCGYGPDDQCLAHLVLGLLQPSVTAFEPGF